MNARCLFKVFLLAWFGVPPQLAAVQAQPLAPGSRSPAAEVAAALGKGGLAQRKPVLKPQGTGRADVVSSQSSPPDPPASAVIHVQALDGSPLSAVLVQAIEERSSYAARLAAFEQGERTRSQSLLSQPHRITESQLTDDQGEFRFTSLAPGEYRLRVQVWGGVLDEPQPLVVRPGGQSPIDSDVRIAPFKKGIWRTISCPEGLPSPYLSALLLANGELWIGCNGGGIARFDGSSFKNYRPADGAVGDYVWSSVFQPPHSLWFGRMDGSLLRFDGRRWTRYTTKNGLPPKIANASTVAEAMAVDAKNRLWIGTGGLGKGSGATVYDPAAHRPADKMFTTFTTKDGLLSDSVHSIWPAPDGTIWFGTKGGLSIYDGHRFINGTKHYGLPPGPIQAVAGARDGAVWFLVGSRLGRLYPHAAANGAFRLRLFGRTDGFLGGVGRLHLDAEGIL